MQEIWKPVPGFESFYEISSLGRIQAKPRARRGVSKRGTEFIRNVPGANNLEWCTPTENILHAINSGLIPKLMGSDKGTSKLNEDTVFVIKKMILLGFTNKKLAEIFNVSTAPISYIRNNQAWTHVPW